MSDKSKIEQEEKNHEQLADVFHEYHGTMPENFLRIAQDAKMELLKEKMKQQIEAKQGKELEKIAKLVTDEEDYRWLHKIQIRNHCAEWKKKMYAFFKK